MMTDMSYQDVDAHKTLVNQLHLCELTSIFVYY